MGRREKPPSTSEPVQGQQSMGKQSFANRNSLAKPQNRQSFSGNPQANSSAPMGFAPAYQTAGYSNGNGYGGLPLSGSNNQGMNQGGYPNGNGGFGPYPVPGNAMRGAPPLPEPFYPMEGSGHMTPQQYAMMMNGGGAVGGAPYVPPQQYQLMYPPNGTPPVPYMTPQQSPQYGSNMPSPQPGLQRRQSMRGPTGATPTVPSQVMNAPSPQGGLQRQQSMRGAPVQPGTTQPGLQRQQSMRGAPVQPGTAQPGLQRQQSMRGAPVQPGTAQPGLQRQQSMRGAPVQPGTTQPGLQRQQSMRGGYNAMNAVSQTASPLQQQERGNMRRTVSSGASLGEGAGNPASGISDRLSRSARESTNPNYTNLFATKQPQALPAQLAPLPAQRPPPGDGYSPQQIQQLQSLPPLPTLAAQDGRIMQVPFPFPIPPQYLPNMSAHLSGVAPSPPISTSPQAVPSVNGWTGDPFAQQGQLPPSQVAPGFGGAQPSPQHMPTSPTPQVSPSAAPHGGLQRMPSILNRKSSFKKDKTAENKNGGASELEKTEGTGKNPNAAPPSEPAYSASAVTAAPSGSAVVGTARKLTADERNALMRQREAEYMATKLQQLEREKAEEERLRQLRFQQAMQRKQSAFAAYSEEAELQAQQRQQQAPARDDDDFTREPAVAPAVTAPQPERQSDPIPADGAKRGSAYRTPQSSRGGAESATAPPPAQPQQQDSAETQKPSRLKPKQTGSARQQHRMESVGEASKAAPFLSSASQATTSASPPVPGHQAFNAEPSDVSDGTRTNLGTVSTRAQSGGRRRSAVPQLPPPPSAARQHRCPTLLLYEMPLRSRKNKGEPIDDSNNALKTYGDDLTDVRVTASTGDVRKFKVDELVAHRKGSHLIDSKVLSKVKNVFLSGRSAAVVGLDSEKLSSTSSPFESPSSLAQQRLLRDILKDVARFAEKLDRANGSDGASYVDASVSFALVKKMSANMEAEMADTMESGLSKAPLRGSSRTHEVMDLLRDDAEVTVFRQETSPLYGARLAGVEYRCLQSEDELGGALVCAQANAGKFCGDLLDRAAAATDAEEKARLEAEVASCVYVTTCVLTHHKAGAPIVVNTELTPADLGAPEASEEEEDDAILQPLRRTVPLDSPAPASSSDTIMSVLTCIGVENRLSVVAGALASDSAAPLAVFEPILGAPCYTAVIMAAEPTDAQCEDGLSAQAKLAACMHPKPLNGSLWQYTQRHMYEIATARQRLADSAFGSDAQRKAKLQVKKSTQALEQVAPLLMLDRSKRFSIQN